MKDMYLHSLKTVNIKIDGLVQERRDSIPNALELRLPRINSSRWFTQLKPFLIADEDSFIIYYLYPGC